MALLAVDFAPDGQLLAPAADATVVAVAYA
jgi:hypothetical protein